MFPKPKRIKDRKLLNEVKKRPCIVCGKSPTDPDHIEQASRRQDTERGVWPLCRIPHHVERHAIGIRRFAAKYPRLIEELRRRGYTDLANEAEEMRNNGKV
jgi:hypothetical protein